MAGFEDYEAYDGLGLAELVRAKEVAPTDLLEAAIARIERHNPALNAVVHEMYDAARRAIADGLPEGPFTGVPFLLKDLGALTSGEPTTSGSRLFADFVADHDTTLTERIRAAGLVIMGKTNTPEMGVSPACEPVLHGAARNPWNPERSSGGSSGGAAVAVAANGRQVALMAPTELLAEQHARSIRALSGANQRILGLRVGLLTASLPRAEAADVLAALAAGEIDLMIGTHALIQQKVEFRDLALAIVDEQHRFGVLQRASLMAGARGSLSPHVLVMTATPIPRTLALTGYGDLDLSVIDELPPGRSPTETIAMGAGDGERIMQMIRDTTARGEQVYVVYPLVEESEKLDLRSAMESAERIGAAFPELRVDLLHGRLDAARRGRVMDRFARGQIDILVATTVIEVGVDVANASLMIIEHAERFGLAQLHQLRGRVGRGTASGTCLLVSRGGGGDARARLDAMLRTGDGFEIADADLEIRGPGDFLGTRQSGHLPELRIADLLRDVELVAIAREVARRVVDQDPTLSRLPATRRAVRKRWGRRIDLTAVG
ncbi:MAG: DEAD/DEAH box helicase [Proteobacteria bacterium]|nr:DEAD/DEAH box helicase [Pseudomonadota bacterium]